MAILENLVLLSGEELISKPTHFRLRCVSRSNKGPCGWVSPIVPTLDSGDVYEEWNEHRDNTTEILIGKDGEVCGRTAHVYCEEYFRPAANPTSGVE